MSKSIIAEGKTTNEAISNGLKQLNVSKDKVDIKVLDNQEKRSFFSILAPRVVKVELTLKDGTFAKKNTEKDEHIRERKEINEEELEIAQKNIEIFLNDFTKNFSNITYKMNRENEFIKIDIEGEDSSKLIGYRGDVLNSLQTIIKSIANKNCTSKIGVILNIGDYKEKREKALEELADKISKTVLKTGKTITLEPMVAYERKIIHNRLQNVNNIKTYSVGNEPYRKVVISKK